MAASGSDHVWEIADIMALLDAGKAEKRVEATERSYNPYGPALPMVQHSG
jgi:hypothetical protein